MNRYADYLFAVLIYTTGLVSGGLVVWGVCEDHGSADIVLELPMHEQEVFEMQEPEYPGWTEVFRAVCEVESGMDPNAVNESENAVGIAQIRPIMVEEINRISKLQGRDVRFTLEDRKDPRLSQIMFNIYSDYWSEQLADYSIEGRVRRWNGGPDGHNKGATREYWLKVQSALGAG